MRSPRSSELREALRGFSGELRENVSLSSATHLRLGGPAERFVEPQTDEDLVAVYRVCRDLDVPVRVLGGGSNLLIADRGVSGMVISTRALNRVDIHRNRISAGPGVTLPSLLRHARERGLAGLEPLVGIPAMVGGAVAMNAGTRDGETFDRLASVTVVEPSGEVRVLARQECRPGYRDGGLGERVVLEVTFDLQEDSPAAIHARFLRSLERRNATQPVTEKSIGCVFRNPPGRSAGQLIDAAGCKGMSHGAMTVSDVHANFFINQGGGKSADFLSLVDDVRSRVQVHAGVELQPEFRMWGF